MPLGAQLRIIQTRAITFVWAHLRRGALDAYESFDMNVVARILYFISMLGMNGEYSVKR